METNEHTETNTMKLVFGLMDCMFPRKEGSDNMNESLIMIKQ